MKRCGAWTAVVFALAWGPALAQTAPRPSIITNPDWLRRPDSADLAKSYPPIADDLRLEGRVVITCQALATGSLSDCHALSEQPKGLGFAAAALTMADKFHMRPATRDGVPIDGGTVRIPIRFSPQPIERHAAPYRAADPEKVALARRMVERLVDASGFFEEFYKSEYKVTPTGADPATFTAAVSALADALKQERDPLLDAMAEGFAQVMSESDLQAGLQVFTSFDRRLPGGIPPALAQSEEVKAFMSKFQAMEEPPGFDAVGDRISTAARNTFCASHDCSISVTDVQPSSSTR